jgi:hypothetical protein
MNVPIPITVPYSDFLSSAETEGGQRRMRAKKRKKAKEREERRREDCVLDGRDMLEGQVEVRRALEPILFFILYSKRPRRLICHVTHIVIISHIVITATQSRKIRIYVSFVSIFVIRHKIHPTASTVRKW